MKSSVRRTAATLCALVGFTVVPAQVRAESSNPPRDVLVAGDSLAAGSLSSLREALPRWRVLADVSRAPLPAEQVARALRARRRLPAVIHVSAGTADDPAEPVRLRRAVRSVMRTVGPRRCVVWSNVWQQRTFPPYDDSLNIVLTGETGRYPNLRVLDWHRLVTARPGLVVGGGTGLTAAGRRARARAVAREVRACRSGAPRKLPPGQRLLAIGDSLAVFTEPFLVRALADWRVRHEVRVSRTMGESLRVLRRLGARMPPIIHLSVGTIHEPQDVADFAHFVAEATRLTGVDRCVVWANIHRPGVDGMTYAGFNRIIAAQVASHSNMRLVDWHGMVRRHREWVSRTDHVHPVAAGYRARARAIASAVRSCLNPRR